MSGVFADWCHPCKRCGAKLPLNRFYRLCARCCEQVAKDPAEKQKWLVDEKPMPPRPTRAPAGSEKKLVILRRRCLARRELFHPDDNPLISWPRANVQAQQSEPIVRAAGVTGIERDGNFWRCRPMHRGKKHDLGSFPVEQEAEAVRVVRAFWLEVLNLPECATQQQIEIAREKAAEESRTISRKKVADERRNGPTALFG